MRADAEASGRLDVVVAVVDEQQVVDRHAELPAAPPERLGVGFGDAEAAGERDEFEVP